MFLAEKSKSAAVECQNDRLVRVAMAELVGTHREIRHVRLEDCVAGHFPEHAGVSLAALLPGDHLRSANILDEISLVPAFFDALGLVVVIGGSIVAIREREIRIRYQTHAPEQIERQRERRHRQEPRGMLRIGVLVLVKHIHRNREQAAFAPFHFICVGPPPTVVTPRPAIHTISCS